MKQYAFTLFEVIISVALLASGMLVILMLIPTAMKAQGNARFQLYAAAKAIDLVDVFMTQPMADTSADGESPLPWDTSMSYKVTSPDLEAKTGSMRGGLYPLPTAIARRIDSDGDEIQRILDAGGQIYYGQPTATIGINERLKDQPLRTPNETRRLIIGVVGHAQINNIPVMPWKAWPYYMPYPSPPALVLQNNPSWKRYSNIGDIEANYWSEETTLHPDNVMPAPQDLRRIIIEGLSPIISTISQPAAGNYNIPSAVTIPKAQKYFAIARWYARYHAHLPDDLLNGVPTPQASLITQGWHANPVYVNSARYLAHAAMTLTRAYEDNANFPVDIPAFALTGVPIAPAPSTTDAVTVSLEQVVAYHENALRLGCLHAAYFPYNWGAPRPTNRAIMMDVPLVQYDPFSPPRNGILNGSANIEAHQWRAISAQPIQQIGVSRSFANTTIAGDTWSSQSDHFTLTAPFSADERARSIVVWSVDWQQYSDAETAPSAPVDASRYPITAPRPPHLGSDWSFSQRISMPGSGNIVNGPTRFRDIFQQSFRNPEKTLLFVEDVTSRPTGDFIYDITANVDDRYHHLTTGGGYSSQIGVFDQGPNVPQTVRTDNINRTVIPPMVFSGRYGADRNANGNLDRGPIDSGIRLRAATIARFSFYDPRLQMLLR